MRRTKSFWNDLAELGMKAEDRPFIEHVLAVAREQQVPREQVEQAVTQFFTDVAPALTAGAIDQATAWEQVLAPLQFTEQQRAAVDEAMRQSPPTAPTVEADQQRLSVIETILATDASQYWREGLAAEMQDILARHEARPDGSFTQARRDRGTTGEPEPTRSAAQQQTIDEVQAMLKTSEGFRQYWGDAGVRDRYASALEGTGASSDKAAASAEGVGLPTIASMGSAATAPAVGP